ncbi:MAG: glycosyltransferase [Chitinophagaceae bacterium]|nr:MAG: glycosyltransferase [Chitinophagaceae bacterium]
MISIIIPAYNEAGVIGKTLHYLAGCNDINQVSEIIVCDGGSNDNTVEEAKAAGARTIISPKKGRAAQMNYGAAGAKEPVLYFLHADSMPPCNFVSLIIKSVESKYDCGCFRLRFDHPQCFLKVVAWFTRFHSALIRFGDQSLFVRKGLFDRIGGFNEKCIIMEDQEIVRRLKKLGKFKVIPSYLTTSARKFIENGHYRLMGIFFYIYLLYYLGFSQSVLLKQYRKLITHGKV